MKRFSPMLFLASLGAGGIAVSGFGFMQNTIAHGPGLLNISQVGYGALPIGMELIYRLLELKMIVFSVLHLALTGIFLVKLNHWRKTPAFAEVAGDPLRNSMLVTPFISITMTLNVFLGPVRYFFPPIAENLQALMLPGMIAWSLIWGALMLVEIWMLKTAFAKSYDVNKIHFGWLLHPFALAMATVTGTGIAALAKNADIAHTAAFMSIVSGSMGFFLMSVKLIALFKSHFAAPGLPEKSFLPSILIVVPNITLFAISAIRLGHYFHNQFGIDAHGVSLVVAVTAFAFESWYLLFGLLLLRDYFRDNFFDEFNVTQWSFVCPLVAFGVLGSFVAKLFVGGPVLLTVILLTTALSVSLFFVLLARQMKCAKLWKLSSITCD
jgi:Voltage-dependent anion channel